MNGFIKLRIAWNHEINYYKAVSFYTNSKMNQYFLIRVYVVNYFNK